MSERKEEKNTELRELFLGLEPETLVVRKGRLMWLDVLIKTNMPSPPGGHEKIRFVLSECTDPEQVEEENKWQPANPFLH